jgi:hypothetical protein
VNDHNGKIEFISIKDGAKIKVIFIIKNEWRNFNRWW